MITIPTALLNEFVKDATHTALLLHIDATDADYDYTNIDEPVYFNSVTYTPVPFEIPSFSQSSGFNKGELQIKFDNVSLLPTSLFLNNEERGREIVVYIAMLDSYGRVQGSALFEAFRGYLSEVSLTEKEAEITAVQELAWWNKSTLRTYNYRDFVHMSDLEGKAIYWGRPNPV